MRRRVLKFGGTSVGSAEALSSAVGIVQAANAERPLVVVVSALAGVTNALEAAVAGASSAGLDIGRFTDALCERHLALVASVAPGRTAPVVAALRERTDELAARLRRFGLTGSGLGSGSSPGRSAPASRAAGRAELAAARAAVLALGERLSAPIVAAALRARGLDAHALDAAALVRTNDAWGEAAVDFPATRSLVRAAIGALPPGSVPVVTGFIGGTAAGDTTLLGRGGSDYTAAVLGWALEAERVEIWSDVPGVMTGDPRRDAGARTLDRLSYGEAAALARAGAKVLHPRTLEPLEPVGIPLFVGSTLAPDAGGTWIGLGAATSEAREGTAA